MLIRELWPFACARIPLLFCVALSVWIAISRKAANPISGGDLKPDTSLSTIIHVAGLDDLSAIGQASNLRQAIIALERAEAETESGDTDLDRPLNSVVLAKLGDSYYERFKFLLKAVVDPCDNWSPAWPERWRHDTWLSETFGFFGPKIASASNWLNASRSVPQVIHLWKLSTNNPRRRLS